MATIIPPSVAPTYSKTLLTHDCQNFQYDFHENIILSILFSICFFIGLCLVFAGYRFFRTSLFFQTSSIVSALTYLIVSNLLDKSDALDGIVTASAGLFIGIVAMFVTTLGLLFSSLIQSIFVTSCILYTIHVFTTVTNIFVAPSIALATFVALSVPVIKWQRAVSIMYITSFGAILVMLSIDFFLDLSMLRMAAYENVLLLERSITPCWFSWTLLGLWPLLLFFGCVVQFLKTGKEHDHRHNSQWFRRHNSEPKVRLLSSKSDVIAKAWISNPTSPSPSEKFSHNISGPQSDDEVFLMEDTTAV